MASTPIRRRSRQSQMQVGAATPRRKAVSAVLARGLEFTLVANGNGVLTPVLEAGAWFVITISGTYQWQEESDAEYACADACRTAENESELVEWGEAYQGVTFDGAAAEPFELHPQAHRYSFCWLGEGARIMVALRPPPGAGRGVGSLSVAIAPPTGAQRVVLEELKTREVKLREAAFEPRIQALIARYRSCPEYAEREHLERIARTKRAELLAERESILAEAEEFHRDVDFVAALRERSPETYERAQWKTQALTLAEGFVPDERPSGKPLDEEEVREWKARRILRGFLDERRVVDVLRDAGVPEDEIERYQAEYRREQQDHDERRRGKGGTIDL